MSSAVRLAAYKLLLNCWQQTPGFRLDAALRESRFTDQDLRWLRTHVYGACRTWHACAWLLAQASKTPLHKLDVRVRVLLQLGTYWLRFMDSMPAYAAVQQIGELARQARLPKHLCGFINGVLRHISADAVIPDAAWLPEWLTVEPQCLPQMLKALQPPPPLGLRVRPGFALPQAAMAAAGWHVTPLAPDDPEDNAKTNLIDASQIDGSQTAPQQAACWLASRAEKAEHSLPLTELPGFADGHWLIQDASSAQVATVMAQHLSAKVIVDACAGLGMKTMALADAYPHAHVIALEPDARRFAQLQQNLQRCQLTDRVTAVQTTAQQWQPSQSIDVVLTDVPCSATGTVRRHPEILLRSQPLDLGLIQQQRDILTAALAWRPRHLVYSTCSVLPAENVQQVDWLATQGLTPVLIKDISIKNTNDGFHIAILSA